MTETCLDCSGTGVVRTETGARSTAQPFMPSMGKAYCDCAAGRDLRKDTSKFGPAYPAHISEERAYDRLYAARIAEGLRRCWGMCGGWVQGASLCERCGNE